jgi:hypothetical protein
MEIDRKKLLQQREVVEEINRYKWLMSETMGCDIGFDAAAEEWFEKHGTAWVKHYFPGIEKKTEINNQGNSYVESSYCRR